MVESAQRSLRAELVTDGFCMAGRLDVLSAQGRLVDILNFGGEPFILLHAVETRRLGPQSDKVFNCPTAQIRREAIILAIPQEHRSPAAAAQHPLEYVAKEPHRVSFLFPAFAVVGDLHLARGADINAASPLRGGGFVPLTDAEAVYLPVPARVWRAAVIIVNVAKAEVCFFGPGLSLQQFS
jgi:hypothetical protein